MFEYVLEQVERKSAQSVSVGNHNFSEIALERKVQNPLEARPMEVETGSNVGDRSVVGILGLQLLSLSIEITRLFLMGRGDSGVDDVRFLPLVFGGGADNRVDIVESLTSGGANVMDEVSIGPTPESFIGDSKTVRGVGRFEPKFGLFIHWDREGEWSEAR